MTQMVSAERAAALRSKCLSLAKTCSIGFRSGEYFGTATLPSPRAILGTTLSSSVLCAMELADYLRDQAVMYRQLAERSDDPVVKNEMLELASICEEVANNIEDHLTGG